MRGSFALWLVVCVTALMLAFPSVARADDATELEYARTRLDGGLYEEALKRLDVLLDPKRPSCDKGATGNCRLTDPDLVERARSFAVIALVALGKLNDADLQIEKILRSNPTFVAGPPLFPVAVADRFTAVRSKLKPELDKILASKSNSEHATQVYEEAKRKWLEDIQTLAAEETLVEPNSRWIALIPFGVGHFQNGNKTFGILFASLEAIAGAGSVITAAVVGQLSSADPTTIDATAQNARIQTGLTFNRAFFATWAVATGVDIITAQATFVPYTETTRNRPIPAPPKAPVITGFGLTPLPGGFAAGVSGHF